MANKIMQAADESMMDRIRRDLGQPPKPELYRPKPMAPLAPSAAAVRDGVLHDNHGDRSPDAWISSTGETGHGPIPNRMKKLVPYDPSPADYSFPPTSFKE